MLRGKEVKQFFGPWARVHVYEDQEALGQPPPDDCVRVFYVSAGNALCRHPLTFANFAFKNIRTEAFLKKVGGVILLGSVDLWQRLYAPTRASGTLVNPSFFDEVTKLLKELDVPVMHLDNDFMDNLPYTSDVHPCPGKARYDLAKHVEDNLIELSQSAADERGVDPSWMKEYEMACTKGATNGADRWKSSCKWCRLGECWDHQGAQLAEAKKAANAASASSSQGASVLPVQTAGCAVLRTGAKNPLQAHMEKLEAQRKPANGLINPLQAHMAKVANGANVQPVQTARCAMLRTGGLLDGIM
jgi:hypothetical protein